MIYPDVGRYPFRLWSSTRGQGVFLKAPPPCMLSMFPCSSTPDSYEWVVLSLLQSLKTRPIHLNQVCWSRETWRVPRGPGLRNTVLTVSWTELIWTVLFLEATYPSELPTDYRSHHRCLHLLNLFSFLLQPLAFFSLLDVAVA